MVDTPGFCVKLVMIRRKMPPRKGRASYYLDIRNVSLWPLAVDHNFLVDSSAKMAMKSFSYLARRRLNQ
jgi:hypothetical protein